MRMHLAAAKHHLFISRNPIVHPWNMINIHCISHCISAWCFGTFVIFHIYIYIYGIRNNHPNWPSYFSEGLKPPTRFKFFDVSKQLRVPELLNLGLLSDQINTYGVATSQDRAEYLHISRRDGGFHGAFGARIRKTDLYIFVLAIGIVSRVRNLQKKYIYIYI